MWIPLLIILICSVYAPFLGLRLLRMAGDEKVYISQALEMERAGNWFVQRLQDRPDYYKGPLHYLLLRAGMILFGHSSAWPVLYMNLVLVILGAIALGSIVRRRLPEWEGGPLFIGAAFALSVGVYAHTWASQMEVELASLFAIAYFFLDVSEPDDAAIGFWTVAAVAGWAKSPLHAVFLGFSALLYWCLRGEILERLVNPWTYVGIVWGILLCAGGYAPAYFLDRQNFVDLYFTRETLSKGPSGQEWTVSIYSSFGFYLFPWLTMALISYARLALGGFWSVLSAGPLRRIFFLGVAGFAPSVAFFIWHPYHFENYDLPVIGAIWLMLVSIWGGLAYRRFHHREAMSDGFWESLYAAGFALTGLVVVLAPVALSVLAARFSPLPEWWPRGLLFAVWGSALVGAFGFFYYGVYDRARRAGMLAFFGSAFLWGISALFAVLGERELVDLRAYLAEKAAHNEKVELGYYNLNQNIWSEWGYLNFWLGREVRGLHTSATLKDAILRGDTILVTSKDNGVEEFKAWAAKEVPDLKLVFHPWHRWRTQGRTPDGQPLWRAAWDQHNLGVLETEYEIVEPATGPAAAAAKPAPTPSALPSEAPVEPPARRVKPSGAI